MKLYLLSCQNLQTHVQRILPLLPGSRQLEYARSRSSLTLGAGLILASVLDVHSDDDLVIGQYGKPSLSSGKAEFSLSHSGGRVLLGVSDSLIGVDMERRDRRLNEAMRERVCLPQEKEQDLLTVFTRKECAMKLTGLGFSLPLQQIDTTKDYLWGDMTFHFFTAEKEGYMISVLTVEEELSEIQSLYPTDLL